MKAAGLVLVVGLAAFLLPRNMTANYFSPAEFGDWWPYISPDLLAKLNRYRELWGGPVVVSQVEGGIGRHLGAGELSQHNVDRWGEVRAVDVFPKVGDGYITDLTDMNRAYSAARQAGFTGIGLYTDTQPGFMLHLDVRQDRTSENPAQWSRVDGRYLAIGSALA